MRNRSRSQFTPGRRQAFTFMEVTVAVIILVVGLLPVYSIMQGGAKRARYNKIRAFAASLAQNTIERIRGYSLEHLETNFGPGSWEAGVLQLRDEDAIFIPRSGDPGVPTDDEMKHLLDEWNRRRDKFTLHMLPIQEDQGIGDLSKYRSRLIGVKLYWGRAKQTAQHPTSPSELTRGRDFLSLVAIAGEGLFHPPPIP